MGRRAHDELERLLPWYVNGTLGEAEMDRLNCHLAGCDHCTGRVRAEIRLARSFRELPAGAERMPDADLVWAGLAAGLPRRSVVRRRPAGPVAALGVAIAAAAFLLGQLLQPPAYRTLTRAGAHSGPVIQLVLEGTAVEGPTLRLIEEHGGAVLTRSHPAGAYRIGLPPGADPQALLIHLERLPSVRWAALEQP